MPYQSVDDTITQKRDIKKRLYKKLKISYSSKRPLISIIVDKDLKEEETKILRSFNEGVCDLDADFVLLSESALDGFSNFIFIEYNLGNRELILEASDFIISNDSTDLEEVMMRACVVIGKEKPSLINYNAQTEQGNAFCFKNYRIFSLFEACVRAIESYKFPWDFKHIIKSGVKKNFKIKN